MFRLADICGVKEMKENEVRNFKEIENKLAGKKVLYISSKGISYLRISQQVRLIKEKSKECKFIVSENKNYFFHLISIILRTFKVNTQKFDLVFVGAFPQFIVPLFKRKFKSCELWTDLHISFYDTLVFDRKKVKKDSLCGKMLWNLDKKTMDLSQYIVADTKIHGMYFAKEFLQDIDKIFVMYLEADKKIYHPMNIAKPCKLQDKYVVFYFGSMNPLQGIDTILKAVEMLKNEENIFFVIVGPISKGIKKYMGKTVEYFNWLKQEEIAKYIAMSDLCLAGHFSADVEKANRTIPGKAYMYEAMGKKMILGDSEANRELFHEDANHIFTKMGEPEALVKGIKKLYPNTNMELGRK